MDNSNEYSFASVTNNLLLGFQRLSDAILVVKDWLNKNSETILTYINAFTYFGIWCAAVDKLKDSHIIFTDDLTYEMANQIYETEDVNAVVNSYYWGNDNQNFDVIVNRCSQNDYVKSYDNFFLEIINAYKIGHYRLACVGLFSLLDGILSDVSGTISTNFKKRINIIWDKISSVTELSNLDKRLLCIYTSMYPFDETIFANTDMKGEEPNQLNRHWAIHGSSHKKYTRDDFLSELLWLDAITIVAKSSE